MTSEFLNLQLAFIGGGNMASAMINGLIARQINPQHIHVLEPLQEARARLSQMGVVTHDQVNEHLNKASLVIWAIKPQMFHQAALPCASFTHNALHLSVAAGIRSDSIAHWLGTQRVVRAMPNTPALVALGQTGLFARSAVSAQDRGLIEVLIATTGQYLWVDEESKLDAVTALSGSGPAYVFYFLEAMIEAGKQLGLSLEQSRQLAIGTFVGASELARASSESPAVLRERVTSKGGTTHAALSVMQEHHLGELFEKAIGAASERAHQLGKEFGK
ncbi:MAG: pyrroline-5-carboxylate reductase [Limnohabitans sp.]|nr:pyrroline-5-carboxylate reductase [Limnohabitans sp.]